MCHLNKNAKKSQLAKGAAFLFSARRARIGVKNSRLTCGSRFDLVHSCFCCAAADLAQTELQIVVAATQGRFKKLQNYPENRKRLKN